MEVMNRLGQARLGRLFAQGYGPGPARELLPNEVVTLYGPERRIFVSGNQAKYHNVGGIGFITPCAVKGLSDDVKVFVLLPEQSQFWFPVGEFLDLKRPAFLQVWKAGIEPETEVPPL